MIKYIAKYSSVFLFLIVFVSCGAFITRQARFLPDQDYNHDLYNERPINRPIEIFLSTQEIKRQYKQIGVIESRQLGDGWTLKEKKESAEQKIINSIKKKALEIGADALIRLETSCDIYLPMFRFGSISSGEMEDRPRDFNSSKDDQYKQVKIYARYMAIAWAQ